MKQTFSCSSCDHVSCSTKPSSVLEKDGLMAFFPKHTSLHLVLSAGLRSADCALLSFYIKSQQV